MARTLFCTIATAFFVVFQAANGYSAGPNDKPQEKSIEIASDHGVGVRLVYRPEITWLVDSDFLNLEYVSETGKPLGVLISYQFDYSALDGSTGKPLQTGSMGKADLIAPAKPENAAADSFTVRQALSAYAGPLMPTPGARGMQLKVTFSGQITISGDSTPRAFKKEFDFSWKHPDARETKVLEKELENLLAVDIFSTSTEIYRLRTLLSVPELTKQLSTSELLGSLSKKHSPGSGRLLVRDFLSANRANEPAVRDYYLKQIEARDADAISDLNDALWSDRFVSPLAAAALNGKRGSRVLIESLSQLDRHASVWSGDAKISEPLSKHILDEYPAIDAPTANAAAIERDAVSIGQGLELLAESRDRGTIPRIAPWLNSQAIINAVALNTQLGRNPMPEHLCDVAFNAICKLRGKPEESVQFNWWPINPGPVQPEPTNQQLADYGQKIAAMKAELEVK